MDYELSDFDHHMGICGNCNELHWMPFGEATFCWKCIAEFNKKVA